MSNLLKVFFALIEPSLFHHNLIVYEYKGRFVSYIRKKSSKLPLWQIHCIILMQICLLLRGFAQICLHMVISQDSSRIEILHIPIHVQQTKCLKHLLVMRRFMTQPWFIHRMIVPPEDYKRKGSCGLGCFFGKSRKYRNSVHQTFTM